MLFKSQREELTGTDGSVYFAGAALVNGGSIALVTGVRQESVENEVITNVDYIHEDGSIEQAFNNTLDPVTFEKFLNKFAMKVGLESKGSAKLTEITRKQVIDDGGLEFLSDAHKNVILRAYLLRLITGATYEDAIVTVKGFVNKIKQQA